MPIVRHGHARMRRLEPPAARPRGLRRPTTATAKPIPTMGVLTRRHSRRNVIPRRTMATAALRRRAPTIRRPHARIQRHRRRELIPPRAAAIRLRRAPTPHRARAIAVAVVAEARTAAAVAAAVVAAAVTAAVAAEALTVAEGPVLTATANLFANSTARPDLQAGLLSVCRACPIAWR